MLLVLALSAILPVRSIAQQAPGPSRPIRARNVLFIVADDHSREVIGAYGNRVIRTPNLDRLAGQGVRFDHAYANSPVCTPSRQSIITGKLPHAVGVTLLRTALPEEQVTIAEHLGALGYQTGAVGKMHFNSQRKHGFEYRVDVPDFRAHQKRHPPAKPPQGTRVRTSWRPFVDSARVWLNADGIPSPYYDAESEGTFLAGKAIQFLEQNRDNRFALWLGFNEPHSPFNFPIEYAGRYKPENMPLPASGPEDERWVPEIFRSLSEADKRGIVASYYTSVEYMDKNVGLVLDALERLGLDENTLVVYVGDHGYNLGHHDRFEKHSMWEPAVGAPLLIRAPGLKPRVTDAMVEFVDLVPTILEVLGAAPMEGLHGRSLLPLLEGGTDEHRDHVFSEYLPDNMAMVRTDTWKYVFATGKEDLAMGYATGYGPSGISHRLYNVKADSLEMKNLVGDPKYSGVLKSLQLKMLERFLDTHPKAAKLPPQLSLEEALVWFCEPPDPQGK